MDLRRFITFKTVVEEGSFLRASQKLCCTQSTVTFHIQQLEQELAIPLFEKIGRRMCLTAAGKNVLPHVYDLTKVMASIRQAARQDDEPGGELRVATGETLLAYKMPPVLQRFKQRAPKSLRSVYAQSEMQFLRRTWHCHPDTAALPFPFRISEQRLLSAESFEQTRCVGCCV